MRNGFSMPEVEQALISCAMQWPDKTMPIVSEFNIQPEHFQTPQNRILFDAVSNFYVNAKPLDLICFTSELRELGLLESLGGPSYITQTWCSTCHSPNSTEYYAGILQEAHAKVLIDAAFGEGQKGIAAPMSDAENVVTEAVQKLTAIPSKQRKHRTLLEAVQEKMERMDNGEDAEDVIKTGITKLDTDSPLRRGDMPLIVGQRKSGKSILALTIATNIARQGTPVLIFSLEDREPKLIDRLVSGLSRLPFYKHKTKHQNDEEHATITKAMTLLGTLPIHIKDDVFTLDGIQSVTRELKARCKIGLVVVDYGQLVRTIERKDVNREQKVAEVSRTLRLLAMELDTPIIVLSQLNENGNTRESRSLEQDATACWEMSMGSDDEETKNIRWLNIPWQRNGKSGVAFKVTFLGAIARVENNHDDDLEFEKRN